MATGWAHEGAVLDQIEDTITDGVLTARARLPAGEGTTHCVECGDEIPERRRQVLPGARTCVGCQSGRDRRIVTAGINRRGSKDSQLKLAALTCGRAGPNGPGMTGHDPAARIEPLAVALYESDCRERAGDMARRTTLSRIRAHYSFPCWTNLPARERAAWRARARKMLDECREWLADEAEWEEAAER